MILYFELWILYFGFWISCFGFWILDLGFCILYFVFWILDLGFWILDFGFRVLDFGFWILDLGFWILDLGSWILDLGFFDKLGADVAFFKTYQEKTTFFLTSWALMWHFSNNISNKWRFCWKAGFLVRGAFLIMFTVQKSQNVGLGAETYCWRYYLKPHLAIKL